MTESPKTEKQVKLKQQQARWFLIIGIVVLLFGLYISAFMIPDTINSLSGPQSMTLSESRQIASTEWTYALIEDGTWDCDTLYAVRGLSARHGRYGSLKEETKFTEIFFTDNTQDVVMLVTLSGEQDCNDIVEQQPTGYLYSMDDGTKQELINDARLARYFDTDTFLEFCGYCGGSNSLIGAVFGIFFMVCGIALLIMYRTVKPSSNS